MVVGSRDDFPSQLKWIGYRCLFDHLPQEQKQYFTSSKKGPRYLWDPFKMGEGGDGGTCPAVVSEHPGLCLYVTLGDHSGFESLHPG